MGLLVPNVARMIANLQEGESIIGITAQAGEEFSSAETMALMVCCQLWLDDLLLLDSLEAEIKQTQYRRCGWIAEPAPDNQTGIHDAPLGKLWIVYKRPTSTNESAPIQTV